VRLEQLAFTISLLILFECPGSKTYRLFDFSAIRAPLSYSNILIAPSNSVNVRCFEDILLIAPLERRAWTFQETLLSRRLLMFSGHNITWQCRKLAEFDFDNPMDGVAHILHSNPSKSGDFPQDSQKLTTIISRSILHKRYH
jgi:hypothetical protein